MTSITTSEEKGFSGHFGQFQHVQHIQGFHLFNLRACIVVVNIASVTETQSTKAVNFGSVLLQVIATYPTRELSLQYGHEQPGRFAMELVRKF